MSGGFYRAFEDRYRGSRDVISARLAVYLPFVRPLVHEGAAALDLGCGRGEWLELLTQAGFAAEGVDLDEGMLAACRERGLRVVNGDALEALRARPDGSLAVVSAFHLVEHIPFEQVQALIAEALRVLQPGGLLIMETPNPENLVVGTSSFYDDPSHLRPLTPKLLGFAVEFGGFGRHTILRLQEAEHLRDAAGVGLFDVLAGVSPDYSVVAQKAGAPAHLASIDNAFAATHGLDLHDLAQRYQQGQDALRGELIGVREQQTATGLAVQQQLATVDAQIAHVHASTVGLGEEQALLTAAQAGFGERLLECERSQEQADLRLDGLEENVQRLARATDEPVVKRLRTRVLELEASHQHAVDESARLAQHVAWIEGRLTHAESEAAALRHQLGELLLRRGGIKVRLVRMLGSGRRRLLDAARTSRLRQPAYAPVRRVVRGVLRRPALKRVARRLVTHFPRLHTRLMQLMYAPAAAASAAPADIDPLALQMSPRSLSIYRALRAASKPKD
ncbi:bifunctional 2-polyprenyl-6-hydroxyphenol methylase/3-demethylubiquinol 3-O-methyltransferase UbiG [Massilia sp. Se16.2.3]|uniref:class I SAM-dependent methyltransferase n=1 Tax=Massilia sp. Se16.2.3 TaxID=2709303 RepID=UPI00160425FC|nr:class I SAM-dependent methyltransferase [Massilia sp. Se16.2.3]QNB01223.1 methyltransferase domain-containing protein [Massilia sp. Se16.2.3]